ncbi:DUF4491 family protein [Candidatus Avelusimicrobium sp.]|uniref:DUF4491 family protein n=1 Tax=Candidatus Avelusimicrobium sp. TaxID=3048833 RepID=UPI003D7EE7C1
MNWQSLVIGAAAFVLIGVFHPLVIWGEYYFSKRIWPVFLVAGLALLVAAIFTKGAILSPLLSIAGFCALWSIKELFEQEKRVQKGWFAKNPKRK